MASRKARARPGAAAVGRAAAADDVGTSVRLYPTIPPRIAAEIVASSTVRLIYQMGYLRPLMPNEHFPEGDPYIARIRDAIRAELQRRERSV